MPGRNIRAIAFYLPQYHPISENDEWWGKGFTEWTNVTKAKPLFKGHYQPCLPADLGFYDLRLPEVREAQAKMAAEYGIEGFCYWNYWFGNGRQILERPIDEILATGKPGFPFCLAWANETWSGIWHGNPKKILIEQTYPGREDYTNYFNYLLKAFHDDRYIKVDGKPLFCVNAPHLIPDMLFFTNLFRELALQNGLKGLYIVANTGSADWDPVANGCDASTLVLVGNLYKGLPKANKLKQQLLKRSWFVNAYKKILKKPVRIFKYKDVIPHLISTQKVDYDSYPCVVPNWDNSARSGLNSMILHQSTPKLFEQHLTDAINLIRDNPPDKRIIFIKAWNEWAEGNYLEPDLKFGKQYLEVVKKVLNARHL